MSGIPGKGKFMRLVYAALTDGEDRGAAKRRRASARAKSHPHFLHRHTEL